MTAFTGVGQLTRLALRRDRIKLGVWVFGTPVLAIALSASVASVYPGERERLIYATTAGANLVYRAFNGPVTGPSEGSVVMAESYMTLAVLTALLSTFAVVRHTRQNEETGRAELLGASVVGRYALLSAALLTVVGANLVTAVGIAFALIGGGLPAAGSVAAASAIGGVGVSFAAIAGVTSQLSGTSRGANALASAAVGLAFLLRAAGDILGESTANGLRVVSAWPSWLSPLGWGSQVRPYGGERWWVLVLPAALLALGVVSAFVLADRRDFGSGLLASRGGPAQASRGLLSPLGLAWRLQRGALFGWAVSIAVLGVSMGSVADEVDDIIGENPVAAEMVSQLGGGQNLVDAYVAAMLGVFALTIGAYVVQGLLRARVEETDGALEAVLATAVSRLRWLSSHILNTTVGALGLMLLAGFTTGLGWGLSAGDLMGRIVRLSGAALAWYPAILVFAGIVVVLFGLLPRWTVALSWVLLITFILLGQLGAVLELPQQVLDLSPYEHIPSAPAVEVTMLPLAVLTGVAALLLTVGLVGFRRRDVTS